MLKTSEFFLSLKISMKCQSRVIFAQINFYFLIYHVTFPVPFLMISMVSLISFITVNLYPILFNIRHLIDYKLYCIGSLS